MILIGLLTFALLGLLSPLPKAERYSTTLTGLALLISLGALFVPELLRDGLGLVFSPTNTLLTAVVSFVSLAVQAYALRHFGGHRNQRLMFRYLIGLTLSLVFFSASGQLFLAAGSLLASNLFLSRLIGFQLEWAAARASSRLALLHLAGGALLLLIAAGLIYYTEGHTSFEALGSGTVSGGWALLIGSLVVLSALAQSAIWPFHRWLIGSANAPTPVSAFMHAGLVNGGAVILYKFYPVWSLLAWSPTLLVVLGGFTAIAGTTWMLVQSDVKRTLTCSTMGQMGFMIMQCGMGLFPAAIAHMIWHGFFKASLFLSAGSTIKAARNKSLSLYGPKALPIFIFGLTMGGLGAFIFWMFTGSTGGLGSTYALLLLFCGITCAHAVMTIAEPSPTTGRLVLAATLGLLGSTIYGLSVWAVESQLAQLTAPALNGLHMGIAGFFVLGWLLMVFRDYLPGTVNDSWIARIYLWALRASQPMRTTLNLRRSAYRL
ncbi:MAG: proton-conducting transporter membrane subunit [Phaeodactylibacter sp.]|uniref:proton-conducting transporter transmembrane domain-containing protein n=1 Tax=Phaeodactylibacter sp. TaxID=1940289 RepID=UPI0032EAA2BE